MVRHGYGDDVIKTHMMFFRCSQNKSYYPFVARWKILIAFLVFVLQGMRNLNFSLVLVFCFRKCCQGGKV